MIIIVNNEFQMPYASEINNCTELSAEIKQMWHTERVNIGSLIVSTAGIGP